MSRPVSSKSLWKRRDAHHREQASALREKLETRLPVLRQLFATVGVREALLFGSMAGGKVTPGSDVDIAVVGCSPQHFYGLAAAIERALDLPLDLLDLDLAPPTFAAIIRQGARRIYP